MNRETVNVIRYHLTPSEVKSAIKEYADGRQADTGDVCIVPDFAGVELDADGGAIITSEYMDK